MNSMMNRSFFWATIIICVFSNFFISGMDNGIDTGKKRKLSSYLRGQNDPDMIIGLEPDQHVSIRDEKNELLMQFSCAQEVIFQIHNSKESNPLVIESKTKPKTSIDTQTDNGNIVKKQKIEKKDSKFSCPYSCPVGKRLFSTCRGFGIHLGKNHNGETCPYSGCTRTQKQRNFARHLIQHALNKDTQKPLISSGQSEEQSSSECETESSSENETESH